MLVTLCYVKKRIEYQSECVMNIKLFLKIIKKKPKPSECEIECLIECQMKVKLNLYQM